MRVFVTFLMLCALLVYSAGCGETPQPTDNATDASTELGAEGPVPPLPEGSSDSTAAEPAEETASEGSADNEGGPALPPAPTP